MRSRVHGSDNQEQITLLPTCIDMISKYTDISPEARIGNNVQIDSFTRIHEDVEIGDNCIIHSNVTISREPASAVA